METNLGWTEQVFRELFNEFNLYPRSIQDLMGYFRYLQYTGIGNRTLPYQFMIVNEEDGEGDLNLVKAINRYIDQVFHEKRRIMSISERELLDRQEDIFRNLKDTDILVINDCIPEEMSDEDRQIWMRLSEFFERKPAIVKFLVASRNIIYLRFRPVDHIFFRTFRNHLETIIPRNEETILFCMERILSEEGYLLMDDFKTDMEAYVCTVYPKADLKERAFLKDLVTRVKLEYFKKIKEDNHILTGEHVPFYKKDIVTEPETDTEAETKDLEAEPVTNEREVSKANEQSVSVEYSLHFKDYEFSSVLDNGSNNEKNVLILSMSTLPRVDLKKGQKVRSTTYWAEIPEAEKTDISENNQKQSFAFFRGISQLEAGTKYWMTRLAAAGRHLDRIIICTTPETLEDVEAYDDKSAVTVYKEGILGFIKDPQSEDTVLSKIVKQSPHVTELREREAEDVLSRTGWKYEDDSIQSVLDQFDTIDTNSIDFYNLGNNSGRQKAIRDTLFYTINKGDYSGDSMPEIRQMNQLYKQIRDVLSDDQGTRINIYLDAQGGQRTFFNLIFSLFSMQNRDIMEIKGVSAIDFDPRKPIHLIRDVTEEFQTVDLVSAVKAFSLYGRGDLLTSYYKKAGQEENGGLIESIQTIADSISISNPSAFEDGIEQLKGQLADEVTGSSSYYYLEQELLDKYRLLLSEENSVLTTVKWCIDNKFYQQALSFIEDKMPSYILEKLFHLAYREITDNNNRNWEWINELDQNASDYRTKLKDIEKATGDHKFYVSIPGKFLYQCFSTLRSNMDQDYVYSICCAIMDKTLSENDVSTIISWILKEDSYLPIRTKIARCLLNLNLQNGRKINLGELSDAAKRSGNTGRIYSDNKMRTELINKTFIKGYNAKDYEDAKVGDSRFDEKHFRRVLFNLNQKNSIINESDENGRKALDIICGAFSVFLQQGNQRTKMFPGFKAGMLPFLVDIINSTGKNDNPGTEKNDNSSVDKNDIPLKTKLEDRIKKKTKHSGDLAHYCYGKYADIMHAAYDWNDDHLKNLIGKSENNPGSEKDVDSELKQYIRFHKTMGKLQRNDGFYDSGYDDYDELVKLNSHFPKVIHQANHRYSILGQAVDFSAGQERHWQKLKYSKAGLMNIYRHDNKIRMEFSPVGKKKDEKGWEILCEIPTVNPEYIELLDQFMGLHAALKQERNVCNHASERGVRLSVQYIRNMLDLYTQMADRLENWNIDVLGK